MIECLNTQRFSRVYICKLQYRKNFPQPAIKWSAGYPIKTRHYISSRKESGSLASTIRIFLLILDSLNKKFKYFFKKSPERVFRINQVLTVPLFCWVKFGWVISAEQNKRFRFVCWWGGTRIWTGEKGFAVPRLTTRPCRQNDTR